MSEKLRLYDRKRQPTGAYKERDELEPGDFIEVVHVWVRSREGAHLLQKRSAMKRLFPLAWDSAAAGAVTGEETPAQAAARELEEELGIKLGQNDLTLLFTAEYPGGFDDYYEAVLEESTPLTIDYAEVSEAGWHSTEEVLSLMEEGLFTSHEGSQKMEERLRAEVLSELKGNIVRSLQTDKGSGRLTLHFEKSALVFEGVLLFEGTIRSEKAPLQSAECELSGKRQRWQLHFPGSTLVIDASRVFLVKGENTCPVCATALQRGGIVLHQQINWTPEGRRITHFTRATKWSLAKDEVKLADYSFLDPASFPLDYCAQCQRYYSRKQT